MITVTVEGKRHWVYGRTPTEARRKLLAYLDGKLSEAEKLSEEVSARSAAESHPEAAPPEPTLLEYLDRWMRFKAPDRAPSTLADWFYLVRSYIVPRPEASRPLSQLSPADIVALCAVGYQSRALKLFRLLHAALKDAVRVFGLIPDNPADRAPRPKIPRFGRRFWTEAQARAFVRTLLDWEEPEWAAFFGLALGCGLRRSELLGLRWEDVDLVSGLVRVRRAVVYVRGQPVEKEPKTPTAERVVVLPDWTRELMGRIGPAEGRVFVRSPRPAYKQLRRLCRAAGVPYIGLHGLRHTGASYALLQGVPVTEVARTLGHSSTAVTLSIYAHAISQLGAGLVARALNSLNGAELSGEVS